MQLVASWLVRDHVQLSSPFIQCLTDSTVYILSEVYRDRSVMARSLVRIFHALNKVSQATFVHL